MNTQRNKVTTLKQVHFIALSNAQRHACTNQLQERKLQQQQRRRQQKLRHYRNESESEEANRSQMMAHLVARSTRAINATEILGQNKD
jgi:hypothetical protein